MLLIFFFKIFIKFLFLLVPLLISVAFLTLLERKLMSALQRRVGPNKVGLLGLLQPFADGIKIVFKDTILPRNIHVLSFILGPIFIFTLSLLTWGFIEFSFGYVFFESPISLLVILLVLGLSIYGILAAGWASNSKYALLGCLRASSQMIAYEICFGLALASLCCFINSLDIRDLVFFQQHYLWLFLPCFPCFLLIFISLLAETYRIPFDLPEAEGEIVAGVHVEYSALLFALFYLAEYSNIIFMSAFISVCFFGGYANIFYLPTFFSFVFKILIFLYFFLSIRASLPRYRYDQLLDIGWRVLFPLSLCFFILYSSLHFLNVKIFFWILYVIFLFFFDFIFINNIYWI